MKIESYNIINNNLDIKFNKQFQQIKFVKMELPFSNTNTCQMESEEIEIKYSKRKSHINVFTLSNNFTIIFVKELDKVDVMLSYYFNTNSHSNLNTNCIQNESSNTYCSIKNENIFAKITKK